MSFEENLREAIKIMGITTKELSAKTGIKEDTISSYLKTNGAMPTAEKAVKLADALNTSVEFLVTGFEKNSRIIVYEMHKTSKYSKYMDALEKIPNESREPILKMISDMSRKYSKN